MEKEQIVLVEEELDTIGEIMNISMGAAATAVSSMLEKQVTITTPILEQNNFEKIDCSGLEPAIIVKIQYTQGFAGSNVIMIRRRDMQIMLNLLMGNDETADLSEEFEFDEMSMSAACEMMNQMMGASSTALSEILDKKINISTPEAYLINSTEDMYDVLHDLKGNDMVVAISFQMIIKDVLDTTFTCFMPIALTKEIVDYLNRSVAQEEPIQPDLPLNNEAKGESLMPEDITVHIHDAQTAVGTADHQSPNFTQPQPQPVEYSAPLNQAEWVNQAYTQPQIRTQVAPTPQHNDAQPHSVAVQNAEFPNFVRQTATVQAPYTSNFNLLMGVQLDVSVVIGRTKRKIKDIMEFGQGSVIELDKQTGAPAEIMVNGQLLAYGDVIVVGDNFGVRITEIVGTKELIDSLGSGQQRR